MSTRFTLLKLYPQVFSVRGYPTGGGPPGVCRSIPHLVDAGLRQPTQSVTSTIIEYRNNCFISPHLFMDRSDIPDVRIPCGKVVDITSPSFSGNYRGHIDRIFAKAYSILREVHKAICWRNT